ncbi:hypothetical protein [Xanthobacter autotrophicus]|uniref:hypothetical protein n=1 Tax=Xanthobacter autotrophicus TaxID=280 RepID=UPI0037283A7C
MAPERVFDTLVGAGIGIILRQRVRRRQDPSRSPSRTTRGPRGCLTTALSEAERLLTNPKPMSFLGATKSPPGARRANVGPFSNEVTIIRPIRTCPVREFAALETIASLGDDRLAGLLALAAS